MRPGTHSWRSCHQTLHSRIGTVRPQHAHACVCACVAAAFAQPGAPAGMPAHGSGSGRARTERERRAALGQTHVALLPPPRTAVHGTLLIAASSPGRLQAGAQVAGQAGGHDGHRGRAVLGQGGAMPGAMIPGPGAMPAAAPSLSDCQSSTALVPPKSSRSSSRSTCTASAAPAASATCTGVRPCALRARSGGAASLARARREATLTPLDCAAAARCSGVAPSSSAAAASVPAASSCATQWSHSDAAMYRGVRPQLSASAAFAPASRSASTESQ